MSFQWSVANLTLGGWFIPSRHGSILRGRECWCCHVGFSVIATARADMMKLNELMYTIKSLLPEAMISLEQNHVLLMKGIYGYYGLNVCISTKFTCWNPDVQSDGLGGQDFRNCLGQGEKPHEWDWCFFLKKKISQKSQLLIQKTQQAIGSPQFRRPSTEPNLLEYWS